MMARLQDILAHKARPDDLVQPSYEDPIVAPASLGQPDNSLVSEDSEQCPTRPEKVSTYVGYFHSDEVTNWLREEEKPPSTLYSLIDFKSTDTPHRSMERNNKGQ